MDRGLLWPDASRDTGRAMSQENVDVFLKGADAMCRRDEGAIPETVHPEMVFEPRRAETEGAFVGHEGMRRFLADTAETFEVFQLQFADVRDLGDRVLAIGSLHVRGRGSGVETDIPIAIVAEYRDGLLWRYKDYGEARSALEAAGLRE
jgi:SnoaL-like domain